jgi:hypothetical protein
MNTITIPPVGRPETELANAWARKLKALKKRRNEAEDAYWSAIHEAVVKAKQPPAAIARELGFSTRQNFHQQYIIRYPKPKK